MDALAFLAAPPAGPPRPVYALVGDEDFLKRRCRDVLVRQVLGDADPDFAVTVFPGDKTPFAAVRAELDTLPFLADRRVVVVETADGFISANRDALERYLTAPSQVGVLILEATKKAVPTTSKLAKALPAAAKIACETPSANKPREVEAWAAAWCQSRHGKTLTGEAANLLVARVGPALGQLDRELEKLAAAVPGGTITPADVDRLVGPAQGANVFRIMEAVGEGRPDEAFAVLAGLLDDGEDPLAILGPLGYQLRKLAAVGKLLALGQPLGPAMDAAGVAKWPQARQGIDKQLRHLGRNRLAQLPDWLVEINLGLKGGSPLKPRLQLELLLAKLAKPRAA